MGRRSKRKTILQAPIHARIESFAHDGRGVARIDDKVVFIDGALPGEEVSFVYTRIRRDYAEGIVKEVMKSSDRRVAPRCQHFEICGGCRLQHLDSASQIEVKQDLLKQQFNRIAKLDDVSFWPALIGPSWGYRRKARLGVKYVPKKSRVLVGFREKHSHFIADMHHCDVLHPKVGNCLLELSEMISTLSVKDRIPQIEVAVANDRCALVFRILENVTQDDRDQLKTFSDYHGFDIYLQSGGLDSVIPLNEGNGSMLSYALPNYNIEFDFKPTDFTQVNIDINCKMVDRVMALLNPNPNDIVLDLFCGLGNFTLPIARRAGFVVGVEGSSELVSRARENAKKNDLDNVDFFSSNLTCDPSSERWARRKYTKVILDPSRMGAKEMVSYMLSWAPHRIVYVSCNPSTLARDAGVLVNELGYRMVGAGVMDMFPHTSHIESIASFEKDT